MMRILYFMMTFSTLSTVNRIYDFLVIDSYFINNTGGVIFNIADGIVAANSSFSVFGALFDGNTAKIITQMMFVKAVPFKIIFNDCTFENIKPSSSLFDFNAFNSCSIMMEMLRLEVLDLLVMCLGIMYVVMSHCFDHNAYPTRIFKIFRL